MKAAKVLFGRGYNNRYNRYRVLLYCIIFAKTCEKNDIVLVVRDEDTGVVNVIISNRVSSSRSRSTIHISIPSTSFPISSEEVVEQPLLSSISNSYSNPQIIQ